MSHNQVNNQIFLDTAEGRREIEFQDLVKYIQDIKDEMQNLSQNARATNAEPEKLSRKVYFNLKSVNEMRDVEDLIISTAAEMTFNHYDYPKISTFLLIKRLHANTHDDYRMVCQQIYSNNGNQIVTAEFLAFVDAHIDVINQAFDYKRDYDVTYFGFRTLENSYLKGDKNKNLIERPQHLYMRVSIGLHYHTGKIDRVLATYHMMSQGYAVHATPTLHNSGTARNQLASCLLMGIEDSMEGIGECNKDVGIISKNGAGIGVCYTDIRCRGALIKSTQGRASGLQCLHIVNSICRVADQGGKRKGSVAAFIEPWHPDLIYFLNLRKNTGAETERARDLFTGLMINDIFMERVKNDEMWSFFCPSECPKLLHKYGAEFRKTYLEYESQGKYVKQMSARKIMYAIMEAKFETGIPYTLYKDAINEKSNQKNIGSVDTSNLCSEVCLVSDKDGYSSCFLCSVGLPKFVYQDGDQVKFDYQKLYEIVRVITRNLNSVIDINYYPLEKIKRLALRDRPIGIGVQGLAEVFNMFMVAFDSPTARELNRYIFETIYYAALVESCQIAKEQGWYETFPGSPISQGIFQFDMWDFDYSTLSGMWDWETLRNEIKVHGVSNSTVTACMPTASTSQILGNNEMFEPFTENIFVRSTAAGDYYVVNKNMIDELSKIGLWDDLVIDAVKYYRGSIGKINKIPENLRHIFRTVWEIPQKHIIEMAAERGPFVDQSQSMNIYLESHDYNKLYSCMMTAWNLGLKTGMYYLRTRETIEPTKFGIDIDRTEMIKNLNSPDLCSIGFVEQEDGSWTFCEQCNA